MSWMFWLIGYVLLLALVLLFFAGVSSGERFEDDDAGHGRSRRVQPPKGHPSEAGQLELSLEQRERSPVPSPPVG